jgi:DNA-binding NarL/FixJ family response regulator
MTNEAAIRVILVDDHELFREGLRALLSNRPGLSVVAAANDAREALRVVAETPCDVVVVDVTLPGSSGIALCRDLKRDNERRPVLILTSDLHPDIVADAFDAGAEGYAVKSQSPQELVEALRAVVAGEQYLAPSLRHLVRGENGRGRSGVLSGLSPREREIFTLLVRGQSNAEIGRALFISVKTVETHRTHIMKKLDVHSISDLVRLAARHGHLAA